MKELGFDAEYYLWVGLFAPKGTPPAILKTLGEGLDKASQTPEYKSVIEKIGQEYAYQNAKDFAAFWEADAKASDEAVRLIGRVG